ncbi:hypothetical protein [Neisseria sp.]|uniref:hypothetical protein n=1 Tax=Neisseria sp. TaxID=192066 RepID=UPI0026DD519D|nr:hypothetical protein [Neisseria sp.]MDO4907520.1 hypothetical protein [Neisseria sp.]
MKFSNICLSLKHQFLIFSILVSLMIFLVNMFEAKKEKFGYKKDYSERNSRIMEEIPIIIRPYQISKVSSAQQGPLSIRNFYIEGTREDYNKINKILEKESISIGFNGICRDGEVILISFDELSNRNRITIQWKYPEKSCSKNKS